MDMTVKQFEPTIIICSSPHLLVILEGSRQGLGKRKGYNSSTNALMQLVLLYPKAHLESSAVNVLNINRDTR